MYNDKVMNEFTHPKNVGVLEGANAIGQVGSAACGDIMKIYLKIENDIITDAKLQTFGCAAAIATTSIATEMVKGKTVEEALKIKNRTGLTCSVGIGYSMMAAKLASEEKKPDGFFEIPSASFLKDLIIDRNVRSGISRPMSSHVRKSSDLILC